MKKIITLLIALFIGGQLIAQKVTPDQLDQIKRMSRKNNHITKTYDGTIEKLVYSFRDIGGPLTSLIFKRSDGKLMLIKFFSWTGKFFKPYLVEGENVSLTVKGDPLLLDVVLYKDQYFKELEFSVQAPINGIADLQKVSSERGTADISEIDRKGTLKGINPDIETLFNVKIVQKTRLDKLREMFIMENGDSLIISKQETPVDEIGNVISYSRMVRDEKNYQYFKNPNVHYSYGGKESWELLVQYGLYEINTNLIQKEELLLEELIAGIDGIVDKALFENSKGDQLELRFNSKDAKQIQALFSRGNKHYVHFQPSMKKNQILAIENQDELIEMSEYLKNYNSELYPESLSKFTGKITHLFPVKGLDLYVPEVLGDELEKMNKEATGFSALLIDENTYVIIPDLTRISIGKDIKIDDVIEVDGYLRNELPGEVISSDYDIIYPKEIRLGRKVFQVKDLIRR